MFFFFFGKTYAKNLGVITSLVANRERVGQDLAAG